MHFSSFDTLHGTNEARRLSWSHIDTDALDCVAVNVAVLLDFVGVADVRTPFAAEWHFAFEAAGEPAHPLLMRSSLAQTVHSYSGCIVDSHTVGIGESIIAGLRELASRGPFLVFGDTYHMPWLPYCGHQHMEHSVIVAGWDDDDVRIVDAYRIRTEWGEAQPSATTIPAAALLESMERLISDRRRIAWTIRQVDTAPKIDFAAVLRDNADEIRRSLAERHALRAFAGYYQAHSGELPLLREFTLNCWLVARARLLHARWLQDRAHDCPNVVTAELVEGFQTLVGSWQKASEFAYISLRRRQDGRLPSQAPFHMIVNQVEPAEIDAARRLSEALSRDPPLQRVGGWAIPC